MQRCRRIAAGRGEPGDVLLDGAHLITDALAAGVPLAGVLGTERALAALSIGTGHHFPCYTAAEDVVDAASPVRSPSGVVAVASWRPQPVAPLLDVPDAAIVGLVGVQDPGNVGTIIRSADALGGSGVVVLDGTADPGGWKALRGAMGSTFRIPVATGAATDVLAAAKARRVRVAATVASGGAALDTRALAPPLLVLIGSEGTGLPPALIEQADTRVTVPMRSRVNSLNAATTASLVLWELTRPARESRQ